MLISQYSAIELGRNNQIEIARELWELNWGPRNWPVE